MRAAGAGRAHSLASSIVFSVFCIVSFVSIYISLVIMISEHTVATAVLNGRHSMWMTHGPREQRRWRGICAACACQMRQPPAGRRPASGQCLKHHIQLLTCKRVLPCESMGVAGEARARVLRACRVRGGRVCWCASAEQARGRGGGEGRGRGEPGARAGCAQKCVAKRHFPYIDSHTDIARVCKSNTMCVSEYEYDARWSTES